MAATKPEGEKRPGGRPRKTEVEPGLAKRICTNLELGMPLALAAEAEGVARLTALEWMRRFKPFAEQVTRARAVGAKTLVQMALAGGKGSSAANWHLERRYRDHYGPPKADIEQPEIKIVIEGGLPPRPR